MARIRVVQLSIWSKNGNKDWSDMVKVSDTSSIVVHGLGNEAIIRINVLQIAQLPQVFGESSAGSIRNVCCFLLYR